jgi:O-antigen ligase
MSEQNFRKIIKLSLWLVPILPLLFYSNLFFPYVILRTVFFRTVILLGIALWLYLVIISKSYAKIKMGRLAWLFLIYLAICFITSLTGADFYKSFYSYFERMDGVLSLIFLFLYLVLLFNIFSQEADWRINIRIILASSLAVAVYGFIQKFSILDIYKAGEVRMSSTIGNPAFLAGYLLLALGIGIYYFFSEQQKYWKYFALLVVALDLTAMLMTSTRSSLLGLTAGILVALALLGIFKRGKIQKVCIAILALIIISGALFALNRSYFAGSKISLVQRLAVTSLSDKNTTNRLLTWQWAWQGIKERPILGIGQENFDIVFNKYFTPRITEYWFDRTHNVYLDILVTSGIFGLAAYLGIFVFSLFLLFKQRRKNITESIIFTCLLAGYFVNNFFVFDTINTNFLFIFVIAFIARPHWEERDLRINPLKSSIFPGILVMGIFLFIFYQSAYKPLLINGWIYKGYYLCMADTDESIASFQKASAHKFGSIEAASQLKSVADIMDKDTTFSSERKAQYAQLALSALRNASWAYRFEIRIKQYLAQFILEKFSQDKALMSEAEKALLDAYELSPGRPDTTYLLYNLYLQQQDRAKAESYIFKLTERFPWFGEPKIILAGSIYKDDLKRADKYFYEGTKLYYRDFGDLKIIEYLINNKRYQETIPYYEKILQYSNAKSEYRLDYVKILYLTGNIDGAIEQLNLLGRTNQNLIDQNPELVNLIYSKIKK